jgi:hypothetical protein
VRTRRYLDKAFSLFDLHVCALDLPVVFDYPIRSLPKARIHVAKRQWRYGLPLRRHSRSAREEGHVDRLRPERRRRLLARHLWSFVCLNKMCM